MSNRKKRKPKRSVVITDDNTVYRYATYEINIYNVECATNCGVNEYILLNFLCGSEIVFKSCTEAQLLNMYKIKKSN